MPRDVYLDRAMLASKHGHEDAILISSGDISVEAHVFSCIFLTSYLSFGTRLETPAVVQLGVGFAAGSILASDAAVHYQIPTLHIR